MYAISDDCYSKNRISEKSAVGQSDLLSPRKYKHHRGPGAGAMFPVNVAPAPDSRFRALLNKKSVLDYSCFLITLRSLFGPRLRSLFGPLFGPRLRSLFEPLLDHVWDHFWDHFWGHFLDHVWVHFLSSFLSACTIREKSIKNPLFMGGCCGPLYACNYFT